MKPPPSRIGGYLDRVPVQPAGYLGRFGPFPLLNGHPMGKSLLLSASELKTLGPGKWKDGAGLYLHVKPLSDGSLGRYWRWRYTYQGRELLASLGVYPRVSLAEARRLRDEAAGKVHKGINPQVEKRQTQGDVRFLAVAEELLAKLAPSSSARTVSKRKWLLQHLRTIHNHRITTLTAPEILQCLHRLEKAGLNETAHRCAFLVSKVYRYAIAKGLIDRNPANRISEALAPVVVEKHAGLTDPRQFSQLLQDIEAYQGYHSTRYALRILPFVFLRSVELRGARWEEIDLQRKLWRVPAGRMKMKEEHLIPLAPQVLELLEELKSITGGEALMFPSVTDPTRPLSDMTLAMALRRMGYSPKQQTVHGFRTAAATLIREREFGPDIAVEKQLAHQARNKVKAAYDQSQMMKTRRVMMTKWADYIADLRSPVWLQILQHDEE